MKRHDPETYLASLREEFPRLRVVAKAEDPLSRGIDAVLRLLTFGGQRAYLTRYVTTLGQTLYVPSDWDARPALERYCVLRHEAVHLRQFRRYGLVGMSLLYLLPILPLGLAWGRARLEWEAYAETFRAHAEVHGIDAARDPRLREHVRSQFTGPAYGWMWPFSAQVDGWIDMLLDALEAPRAPEIV